MRTLKIETLNSVKEQSWIDRDYLMFHAVFQLLVDWVEKEDGLANWNYIDYEESMKTLKELYDWWKKFDTEYDLIADEAQEKLEQLVKLRRYLWT